MRIIKSADSRATFPIAIVVSRFNAKITQALYEGALAECKTRGFADEQITIVEVPGAVEIPLIAKRLAASARYQAIVALGAVVRGETSHFDYVCSQVAEGCQQVALQTNVPVIFGVLTTENAEQALARCGGDKGHKGKEAIAAAVEMVATLEAISG